MRHHLLDHHDLGAERLDGGWRFTRTMVEPTGVLTDEFEQTDEEVLAGGPPDLPSELLEQIARALGREPLDMPWYRDRLRLEGIVGDDVELVRTLLDKATSEHLTLAIRAKAWKVAADAATPLMVAVVLARFDVARGATFLAGDQALGQRSIAVAERDQALESHRPTGRGARARSSPEEEDHEQPEARRAEQERVA